MIPFAQASTFARAGPAPGEHRGAIDAGWAQGRGAYGGLVAAICARALEADAPREQSLVTLTVAFCAPATAGEARVRTELVRGGRNVSTMRATLERDGGETIATALATVARRRAGGLAHGDLRPPEVPAPDRVADGPEAHYIPAFTRGFSFRQCLGPPPFEGGREARVGGWCRIEEDGLAIDAALACALLDAWPPAAAALSDGWCPVASIELAVHFLAPLPLARAEARPWLLYDARSQHVAGGLADESSSLWTEDGRALATARQRIAIFPPGERPPPSR